MTSLGQVSKKFLLVDAVVWSDAYPTSHPLRDVYHWYARWLDDLPGVSLVRAVPEDDLARALDQGLSGVILSGSPRDAWNDDPINEKLCEMIRTCQKRELPFLGVCYGHQILARAFGGTVARHPQGLELGNTSVELTAAGQSCPLFAAVPSPLSVLSSHVDAVLRLPESAELLVRGDHTEVQGFRVGAASFGVQFHPELDPETLRFLWNPRRDAWRARVKFDLDQALNELTPAPSAPSILRNFVTRI